MAQYAHLSTPDPEWVELTAQLPLAQPIDNIQAYREEVMKYEAIRKANTEYKNEMKVVETKIPVEDGEIRVKAYIPHVQGGETEGFPLMVWMYGGGWILGTIENDEPLLSNLALNSRITCVCGDYRKAPEHPFPAAVNDSYAVLKWALNNASELLVNISKGVIIGGASAGGNLAAALAHRALKDPELHNVITGQLLVVPSVISPHAYPEKFKPELLSADEDADKYCLTKDQVLAFSKAYHSGIHAENPEVSPALAESFEGLPPAYMQICGLDPLRDDGFLYERLLKEAGVPTKVDVYPGLPHGFHYISPKLTAAKKQNTDFIHGLDWLLGRTK